MTFLYARSFGKNILVRRTSSQGENKDLASRTRSSNRMAREHPQVLQIMASIEAGANLRKPARGALDWGAVWSISIRRFTSIGCQIAARKFCSLFTRGIKLSESSASKEPKACCRHSRTRLREIRDGMSSAKKRRVQVRRATLKLLATSRNSSLLPPPSSRFRSPFACP
jgi:hypothetical protein